MNLLREYINYLRRSKTKYGIHSPFVFDWVSKGMTAKPENTTKEKLKKIVVAYQKNSNWIEINDLGAGSKKLGSRRRISDIARTSASKGSYATLLWQLARHYQPANILELGTSLGIGTMHLASGHPEAHITSIDGCAETQQVAQHTASQHGFDRIHFVVSDFEHFLLHQNPVIQQLIFVDGHHDGKALLHYMELLKPWSDEQTIFVLDDIRWSDGMLQAWEQLTASDEFHLSMDLFRMGILVRRPGQAKEHFVIRMRSILKGMI